MEDNSDMLCTRCKKRTAVVFITAMQGDEKRNEGLCLVCAKELGIPQVREYMDQMGISDDEVEEFAAAGGDKQITLALLHMSENLPVEERLLFIAKSMEDIECNVQLPLHVINTKTEKHYLLDERKG